MKPINRWFAITMLTIAVPVITLSCGDTDTEPENPVAGGQASGGNESPPGAGSDGVSAAPAGGQAGAGGARSPAVFICGLPAAASECEPVSGAGCDVENGETCDQSGELKAFKCFPDSTAKAGEFCDLATVFCGVGTFCNPDISACQHFCCVDQDCEEGICFRGYDPDGEADIGICSYEFGGGCVYDLEGAVGCRAGGAGGAAGAAGGGFAAQ